jgi:hypothetical protein
MTKAAGRQDEPDPGHFEHFARVVVPGALTEVCDVGEELARDVGEDILARGEAYAALGDAARDVLMSPFAEEVRYYEPRDASMELKGAVSVVVRSSLLEEAHANGPVSAGGIEAITTMAAAPLSHLLAARRRHPAPVADSPFAGLAEAYPRAWACLAAVVRSYGADSGRWPYRAPAAPVPELPEAEVEAPRAENYKSVMGVNAVLISGIDPRIDQLTVEHMRACADGGEDAVWVVASLSRISRNLGKLLRVLEYVLAHHVPVLTANYLLRSGDAWVRRGALAPVDQDNLLAAWQDTRGLSGAHRNIVRRIARELESQQDGSGPDE